jgi:hypothetical protein
MHDRYTASGAHAELVDIGVFMKNSHNFLALPESQPLWTPKIDSFLARIGMPHALINPRYMPTPFPPGTSFAEVNDVASVPYLSDKGPDLYRKFLAEPFPRAFAINEAGSAASNIGGLDPLGRSLRICQNRSVRCGVYAVDDRVVWKPFPTESRERAYKIAVGAGQAATVDFAYRLNPTVVPRRSPNSAKCNHRNTAVSILARGTISPNSPPAARSLHATKIRYTVSPSHIHQPRAIAARTSSASRKTEPAVQKPPS